MERKLTFNKVKFHLNLKDIKTWKNLNKNLLPVLTAGLIQEMFFKSSIYIFFTQSKSMKKGHLKIIGSEQQRAWTFLNKVV